MDSNASKEQRSIGELILTVEDHMRTHGYSNNTIRQARATWNVVKKWAEARGESVVTADLCMDVLRKHYDIEPYGRHLKGRHIAIRHWVMHLLEYQVTGRIYRKAKFCDHQFPDGYKEAGDAFMDALEKENHLRERTLENYHLGLEAAFAYFSAHGATDPAAVSVTMVNEYLKTLIGFTKAHISRNICFLERFFAFALEKGHTTAPLTFPRVSVYESRRVPEYYTADEINRLLAAIDRANSQGKRDYAMILLAVRYGLRICDIRTLKLKDIDFVSNKINVIQQKTGKPLMLDLLPDVGWAVIDYLKDGRPLTDSTTVFVRCVPPHIEFTDNSVSHIVRKYAIVAGINKLTDRNKLHSFHALRHGLASTLLQNDVPITDIQGILGHSNVRVTTIYAKIDDNQLRVCALEVT